MRLSAGVVLLCGCVKLGARTIKAKAIGVLGAPPVDLSKRILQSDFLEVFQVLTSLVYGTCDSRRNVSLSLKLNSGCLSDARLVWELHEDRRVVCAREVNARAAGDHLPHTALASS